MVVLADGRLHDVRHRSAAVHDDPFAVFFALDARLAETGFTHGVAHAGGQRLGLAVGGTRSDDHALEQRGDVLGVKNLNVLRLHVFQTIDDGPLKLLNVFGCAGGGVGHAVLLR